MPKEIQALTVQHQTRVVRAVRILLRMINRVRAGLKDEFVVILGPV